MKFTTLMTLNDNLIAGGHGVYLLQNEGKTFVKKAKDREIKCIEQI